MNLKHAIYHEVLEEDSLTVRKEEIRGVFRASEAGDCKRVLWLRKEGNEPTYEYKDDDDKARVLMLLGDGRAHQDRVTSYIHKIPGFTVTNIESDSILIEDDIVITGHPDLIVHDLTDEDQPKYVVDIKGISTNYCRKLEDNNFEMLKAINPTGRKSVSQLRLYMRMFDTDGGIVIIKDKNSSALFEFFIERDKEKEDRIIQKFKDIHKDCMRGKMTECDFLKGDKRCSYCPYPKDCGRL